jgi:hypothetical protein
MEQSGITASCGSAVDAERAVCYMSETGMEERKIGREEERKTGG